MSQTDESATTATQILQLERAALDRWGKGDPDGFLEITAPDVSYFDPFLEDRVDSLPALTGWYDQIRGKIRIDRDQIIEPRVQFIGSAAILSYRFVSEGSEGRARWNATEVYQHVDGGWKIVHSHWSFTKPPAQ